MAAHQDRPPTNPISVILFIVGAIACFAWFKAAADAPDAGTQDMMFSAGIVAALLLFALASIVNNVSRIAFYAEETAHNTRRTAEEIQAAKQRNPAHIASPATTGSPRS